jgi:acyl-CoA synthetase (AMP-forming)/AMP-acid ligase II
VDGAVPGSIGPFEPAVLKSVCEHGSDERPPCAGTIDIDLASIVYTSGSTGKPKGVMLSHLNLVSNTKSTVSYLRLQETDRIMVVLPFHYIYGTSLLYTHLAVGGSLVIENRFLYPNVVLDAMDQQKVTGFSGVPSTFMLLLNKSTLNSRKFESLRYVTQAGGGMAPSIQMQVQKAFDPAQLFIMYGSTEAAPRLTYLEPRDLPRKWGSIGKAVPNVEVFPADSHGQKVPQGTVGEIVARGSNIMMGYWRDEQGTAEVLRNGLYFTGDIGREDSEGFLYIEGRAKDIIKVGGNRVGAREIEEKILELEGVAEVAVIGVEDPILGEAIKAFVAAKDGHLLVEADLKAQLQKSLPTFKLPKWIVFRPELPKSAAGKILKSKLRQEAAGQTPV